MEIISISSDNSFSEKGKEILSSIGKVRENIETELNTTVLIIGLNTVLDDKLIHKLPNLKLVATPTTWLDHIDLALLDSRGIKLVSLKGETDLLNSITSTAELAFGLILCLARNILPSNKSVLEGDWNRSQFKGITLRGKTLGIIGLGRLGNMVLEYGKSFGMKTIYTDPYVDGGLELPDLLSISDFVSIHVPLTPGTENLLNSESFKIIQSGVIDRENKIEMKKLREAMERLSGDRIQDDFIDV